MLHKSFLKQSNALLVGAVLLSFASIKSDNAELRSKLFDIRDKNIGVNNSPNEVSECLSDLAIEGDTVTIFRNSVAQPSLAVNPSNKKQVIVAYEQDVIGSADVADMGSLSIGIAYSEDGGKHFKHSNSLNTQICNGGFADTVSNIKVTYGANDIAFLTATFANVQENPNTLNQSGTFVSRSMDNGKTWSAPIILSASETTLDDLDVSTPLNNMASVSVDPNNPNNVFITWSNSPESSSFNSNSFISRSTNGGLTFSDNAVLYDPFLDTTFAEMNNGIQGDMGVSNNNIVTMPNGMVLNFMTRTFAAPGVTNDQFVNDMFPYQYRQFDIAFTSSTDNGMTFNTDARSVASFDGNAVFTGGYTYSGADITGGVGTQISTLGSNQMFDVAVNPNNGYLYAIYETGEFSANQLPQIALITSRDGGITWSMPVRVSRTPLTAPNPQAFTPSIAIANNVVGILYQDFRKSEVSIPTTDTNTKTNVWFAQYKEVTNAQGGSTGVGLDFLTESLVSRHSYNIANGPTVEGGVLSNGNYASVVGLDDDFYAAYVKVNNITLVPAQPLIDDVETNTTLLLDNNKRTSPFFSRIDAKN